jgi:hypothetical protein
MKIFVSLLVLFVALLALTIPGRPAKANTHAFENRCGWFSNPTPANASLHDNEKEWIIGVQGGYQAEGDWPTFKPSQWVKTNVNYGYGCACMQVTVDRQEERIVEIRSSQAKALSACRNDPALKKWGFK